MRVVKPNLNDNVTLRNCLHLIVEGLLHDFLAHLLQSVHLVAVSVHSVLGIKLERVRLNILNLCGKTRQLCLDFMALHE